MGYSPRFSRAERATGEIEAAVLAREAMDAARWAMAAERPDDAEATPTDGSPPIAHIAAALAPAGPERVLHLEHVLIAAIWLGSIGLGLFRLLM